MATSPHPVDEILPLPKLAALGLQHVLVMYANAVAARLIVGGALHLAKDQIRLLINADLFACGIATFIQTLGVGPIGIRLPIIKGVTAAAISPLLVIAAMPGVVLPGIYGAVLVVAISIGFGLIPIVAPTFFQRFSPTLKPICGDGIILTAVAAVVLNAFINSASAEGAEAGALTAAQAAEHI